MRYIGGHRKFDSVQHASLVSRDPPLSCCLWNVVHTVGQFRKPHLPSKQRHHSHWDSPYVNKLEAQKTSVSSSLKSCLSRDCVLANVFQDCNAVDINPCIRFLSFTHASTDDKESKTFRFRPSSSIASINLQS